MFSIFKRKIFFHLSKDPKKKIYEIVQITLGFKFQVMWVLI